MTATADYKVTLEHYEGPLDLLLHLVKKHELDVLDIPVSFITEKYLEYLELMRRLNLDIAGEYLLMAATLAHLKSRELLPTPDPAQADVDEGELEIDSRQALIERLLQYQKYRAAAALLGDRPVVGRNVWTRGSEISPEAAAADAPLAEVPVFSLLEALSAVMARARVKLSHDVMVERLSIADCIQALATRLEAEGSFSFLSCFDFLEAGGSAAELKHQVVVTFLSLLEMARLKLVRIVQPGGEGEILIVRQGVACEEPRE